MTEIIKITKINEIFIRIETEPYIKMELSQEFTFEVPGAKFMPAVRNKIWDGKIRLFNLMTGQIYYGLLKDIVDFARKRNYDLSFSDFPEKKSFSEEDIKKFIDKLNPTLTPRSHQLHAFSHAINNNRCLLLSPTGSGKSFIIYLLTRWYAKKTLIIVPTTSLVSQLSSDFQDYGFDSERYVHKIFSGQEKTTDKPIVISTWQSIYKNNKNFFKDFEVVIGDEAHLFKAKSLVSIMEKMPNCAYRFGLTGTLDDTLTNKMVLEGLFGKVEKVISTAELIENSTLSNLKIEGIVLQYPINIKKMVGKMDYQSEMDYIVTLPERNRFIVNLSGSLKGNTLILFQYVEKHGKVLFQLLKEKYSDRNIYFVAGKVKGEDREHIRKIVETDSNAIIVASYGTFSTGVNIKNLHNLIFASPTKAKIRIFQSIGRVLRTMFGKTIATIYDISDDFSTDNRKNTTLLHFVERIRMYNTEGFDYKIRNIPININ